MTPPDAPPTGAAPVPTVPAFGVLQGVKVVYSAVEIAAPSGAALMAEWGADVVWIENTRTGDSMRDTAHIKELERRNQRSVAMNPFSEEGREVLLSLIADADVFVESSKGPTYARRGAPPAWSSCTCPGSASTACPSG